MARWGRSYPIKPHSGDKFRLFRTAAYTLACTAAAFTVTGNSANLHPSNATLTAAPAAYTITANAANLVYQPASLTAQTGTFTFTGNNASLGYNAVIVDQATSYQTFIGWQATAQAAHQWKVLTGGDTYEWPSSTYGSYKDALLAAMLDLGINSLRLEANLADVNATGYDDNSNNAAIQPSTATSGQWHYDRVVSAMDDIAVPYAALLAARGETLNLSLCIVDFKSTGYKAEDTASEYSFFVNKFVDKIFTTYGVKVDTIEAILEPDNGANSNWTAAKVANGIVQANTDLIAAGYTGIRWKAPSVTSVANAATWYADMKTANASVTALLDELPYHRYSGTNTDVATFQAAAAADGNTIAMLEYINATVDQLYDDLTIGQVSSWQQFTITFPYPGSSGDGGQYFYVDSTTYAVSYNPITQYLRQYFRYVRNGAVMKGVTNKTTSAKGTPFVNSNGKYVVPIKCSSAINFDVIGLPAGTYCIRYTTGNLSSTPSAYDTALTPQTIAAGGAVRVAMPAAGVVTVFDGSYRSAMPTGTASFALTGNAATLTYTPVNNYTLTAGTGTFTETGNAANLVAGRNIAPTVATFALTGSAAGLTAQRVIAPTVGTFTLTGINATLTYAPASAYSLSAGTGTFTLTGNVTALTAARQLACSQGAAFVNGTAVATGTFAGTYTARGYYNGLPYFNLVGQADDPAFYAITWNGTDWVAYNNIGFGLTADVSGAMPWDSDWSGSSATVDNSPLVAFSVTRYLAPTTATFTLTGNATGLTAQRLLTASTRTFALTGIDAALTYSPVGSFTLSAQKGTFTLTGNATGLTAQRTLALTKGTFTETGNAAGLYYGRTFAAGTASFSLTGNAAGLRAGRYIAPAVASFVLTGKLVTLNYSAAPSSKVDVVASDAVVNFITISDTALNAVSASDAAVTNLTIGDSTR